MTNIISNKKKENLKKKYEGWAKDLSKKYKDRPMILIIVLVLIQLALLIVIYTKFKSYLKYFTPAMSLITIVMIVHIIDKDMNPAFKISWMAPISIFPAFGTMLYLFLHTFPGNKLGIKSLKENIKKTKPYLFQNKDHISEMKENASEFKGLADYVHKMGPYPVYKNTKVDYYEDTVEGFEAIFAAMRQAKEFIFAEYFILKPGKILDEFVSILEEKVKEGVEVRFMFDAISMFNLPKNFEEELKSKGIKVKIFAPVSPFLSTYQNNRDHRKVLVIDNDQAFSGGVNLADEYVNLIEVYGHWKDNIIRIRGEAVKSMTAIFLQMWNIFADKKEDYDRYLAPRNTFFPNSDEYVIPYADAPGDGESLAKNVYLYMIYEAKKYVHIMTPYLVLDNEVLTALTFAAKRGIDVKIIIPHIPDKKIPFAVARSYYKDLIPEGVKIFEYTPGFVHSKVVVIDGEATTVSTVNMDFRSMYLNFENGIFIHGGETTSKVAEDFQRTLELSHRVEIEGYYAFPKWYRLFGAFMRIFGPLM